MRLSGHSDVWRYVGRSNMPPCEHAWLPITPTTRDRILTFNTKKDAQIFVLTQDWSRYRHEIAPLKIMHQQLNGGQIRDYWHIMV